MEYILIFISAIFVNNIVLSQFLGICPFLGVSKRLLFCGTNYLRRMEALFSHGFHMAPMGISLSDSILLSEAYNRFFKKKRRQL